jgi:hypothetical protein
MPIRILGRTARDGFSGAGALVNEIRKQPFSVVLLDEFEKAHPNIREPSPLVRDAVRNYRTGLIDTVLGGDFDLFG